MRVSVIGAGGRTGRHVVEQALARDHDVTAVVRRHEQVAVTHTALTVAVADVRDRRHLVDAVDGADTIISVLGTGTSRAPTDLYSTGVRHELDAMRASAIGKLAAISAAPAGPRSEQPVLERRLAMPVLERIFGAVYSDMRRMESILRDSDRDWVVLRPPFLVDRAARGRYRLDANPPPGGRKLTCADLATALLDVISRDDLAGRAAYVAN